MSFLDQAKQAANAALNTAANVAQQATAAAQQASAAAQPTLSAAYNSASAVAQQASAAAQPALSSAAATVASTASAGLNQAQAGLHSVAPNVVPAPSGASSASVASSGVDSSHDLAPHGKGTEKLEQLLEHRPDPKELQDRNILKGAPNDALAGKKADLMRAQLESRLDGQIANRPAADELVKEGILKPADAPPAI
ncbi:hypothetical protein QFC21_004507 [Naganishia friedmannii]|uniref:Uncharacterized protein n=1 Tax=Naganishia friedmannii TaxID=89922 RepID=A0ACC2VGK8_9TREE|nr:hypothetical protein QFC21_004507 [Naganishia friedmannii]